MTPPPSLEAERFALRYLDEVAQANQALLEVLRDRNYAGIEPCLERREYAFERLSAHLLASGLSLEVPSLAAAWQGLRALDLEVEGAFQSSLVYLRKSLRNLRSKRQVLGVYGVGLTPTLPVLRPITDFRT